MILEGEQPVEEVGVGLGYNIPPGGTWLVNTCQDNQASELCCPIMNFIQTYPDENKTNKVTYNQVHVYC